MLEYMKQPSYVNETETAHEKQIHNLLDSGALGRRAAD
jgi:hypothetical protein